MKKYILVLAVVLFAAAGYGQTKTLKAFFTGYDDESQLYSFEDADGNYIEFHKVKAEVLKSFDLKSSDLVDEAFIISYTTKAMGDEDDEDYYEENTILDLKKTTLKRNEYSDDDE